jgi:arsenate reductase
MLHGMSHEPLSVLFLCTGNSARSILAESLLNHRGRGRFVGYSAGSHPKSAVHPRALEILAEKSLPTDGLRSKGWDEFATDGSPSLDIIITVCDAAAGEVCPVWPGQPITAHWGIADPAAVPGTEEDQKAAFRIAFLELDSRIEIFTGLPIALLSRTELQERLDAIGRERPHAASPIPP